MHSKRWLVALLALAVAACDDSTGPQVGPVVFAGTMYSGEYRGPEEPRFAGVEVRGRALRGSWTDGCAGGNEIAHGGTTSDSRGEYELTVPLEVGVEVCVRLEAWKDGAVVARGAVDGFRYEDGKGRFEEADLMPGAGFTVVIMPPITRPAP